MRIAPFLGVLLALGLVFFQGRPDVIRAQTGPDCGKAAQIAGTQAFIDCNAEFSMNVLPAQDPGRRFKLSQSYPSPTGPAPTDVTPWMAYNPFTPTPNTAAGRAMKWQTAENYLKAVLAYALQDNTAVDFDVQQNVSDPSKRHWYHTPWLDAGCGGREFVRGLTRERVSRAGELHPNQSQAVENWAVGFYNEPAAWTIGRVWATPNQPDPNTALFPDGSVAFKLLFTTASPSDPGISVPTLVDSPSWQAHIFQGTTCNPNSDENANGVVQASAASNRSIGDVRLLQVDVAVRDIRASASGPTSGASPVQTDWVFGTFIYDGTIPVPAPTGNQPTTRWDNIELRLVPVGLMWGTDPQQSASADLMSTPTTAVYNQNLEESVINPCVITSQRASLTCPNTAVVQHLGLGGRLNGPIDNPASACMSCHGRSGIAANGQFGAEPFAMNLPANSSMNSTNFQRFFPNIPGGVFVATVVNGSSSSQVIRLDYSLQLRAGIENCIHAGVCTLSAPNMFGVPPSPVPDDADPALNVHITRDAP